MVPFNFFFPLRLHSFLNSTPLPEANRINTNYRPSWLPARLPDLEKPHGPLGKILKNGRRWEPILPGQCFDCKGDSTEQVQAM